MPKNKGKVIIFFYPLSPFQTPRDGMNFTPPPPFLAAFTRPGRKKLHQAKTIERTSRETERKREKATNADYDITGW